jgi:hypothetical protein
MNIDIKEYFEKLEQSDKEICLELYKIIDANLPNSENKLWHGHPVWFLNGNPIVGVSKLKNRVNLLFWSGQSFDEEGLSPEGSFKAAQMNYTDVNQINKDDLKRWLEKSVTIQWDYKNIVKRRGKLEKVVIGN